MKSKPSPSLDRESLRKLHEWYKKEHRRLPFREKSDFYSVWVSETMLQQTRVAAMLPLYEKFMQRFADVEALAEATEEEVLSYWKGLGYYSRARNLRKGAQRIIRDHGGVFPTDYEEALKVEGVGPYTAAAVLSISFQKRIPVLDGNVRRVLARLFFLPRPLEKELMELAKKLLGLRPRIHPGLHNQAMMELGATICLTGTPECRACPLSHSCASYQRGGAELAAGLPIKQKQKKTDVSLCVYLMEQKSRYLITKEKTSYFFKNLWFFPYRLFSKERELLFASACLSHIDGNGGLSGPKENLVQKFNFSQVSPETDAFQTFRHQITHHRIQVYIQKIHLSQQASSPPLAIPVTPLAFSSKGTPEGGAVRTSKTAAFQCKWVEKKKLQDFVVSSILRKMGAF